MDHQANNEPKIIRIKLDDLRQPLLEIACTETKFLETRALCQAIVADLRCLQKAYVFEPKHFDRDTICQHLKEILTEYRLLRSDPLRFVSIAEYEDFMAEICTLTAETTQIIHALGRRDLLRREVQQKTVEKAILQSNERHLQHLPPWSQYLAPGAPSLPVAQFLAPFETRPPVDANFPDHRRVSRSSVQALPQAATSILASWALEFQKANDFYRQRYPEEREFAGPLHRKLVPFRQLNLTSTGLKTEAMRLHNLGNRPYAQADEKINGQGPEEKTTMGRFLGKLDGQDVVTPLAANRFYVVRRWVLEKMGS